MPDLTLRPAGPDDARRVWAWRNHETARLASFGTGAIPFERHAEWFARQLARADSRMFIAVSAAGDDLGVVRFDNLGDAPEVSIALAPGQQGRGYGPRILAHACRSIFRDTAASRIVALVRDDNPTSALAFERAGFAREAAIDVAGIPASRFVMERPS